jgi:hypothetical protein
VIVQKLHYDHIPPASKFLESEERGSMTQSSTVLVQIQGVGLTNLMRRRGLLSSGLLSGRLPSVKPKNTNLLGVGCVKSLK